MTGDRKRSGSAKRRRTAQVALRLLPEERDLFQQVAEAQGLSLPAFIRAAAFMVALTSRAKRDDQ